MRGVIIPIALVLLSADAFARWIDIVEGEEAVTSVDQKSIVKNGDIVRISLRVNRKAPAKTEHGVSYKSFYTQNEYDCKNRLKRVIELFYYSEFSLKGKVVEKGVFDGTWSPPRANSLAETLWTFACVETK